jgi:type IV secretory pathway VirB6-like protein
MIGEIDICGVLFPPLLVWVGLALLLSTVLRRGLAAANLYRFIWHRPLFDFSLLVILTGLVSLVMTRFF